MNIEEETIKRKKRIDFYLFLGLLVIVLLAFLFYRFAKTDGFRCMHDPIEYGLQSMEKDYGRVQCSCTASYYKGSVWTFSSDKSEFKEK